ncbi:MAG: hydrogenase nickel incorporation protein HypB [Bacteriovoracaceae bacterium]|nr:hydrogenase nickel incorporation protein HypB [Bacteriovoracaceae bacterium]
MCEDCGCEEGNKKIYFDSLENSVENASQKTIKIETDILDKNNHIAHHNSHWLQDRNIATLNIMSSPGSGKTYLLEKTLDKLGHLKKIAVLIGDQQTDNDAKRLILKEGKVKQINTVSSCHLDASMIQKELGSFVDGSENMLIIENVGNLVCPAAFKLGEKIKIALLSTTEGEDKPLKYPVLFHSADVIIITKTDLIPYLDWDLNKAYEYIKKINPNALIIPVSAKTGDGMTRWYDYLMNEV